MTHTMSMCLSLFALTQERVLKIKENMYMKVALFQRKVYGEKPCARVRGRG
jgi:hypothetical protein